METWRNFSLNFASQGPTQILNISMYWKRHPDEGQYPLSLYKHFGSANPSSFLQNEYRTAH